MDEKYKEILKKKLEEIGTTYLRIDEQAEMYRGWSEGKDLTPLEQAIESFWTEGPELDELSNKINNKDIKDKIEKLISLIKENISKCKGLNNFDVQDYNKDLRHVIGKNHVVNTRTITKEEKIRMNEINKKHSAIKRILSDI